VTAEQQSLAYEKSKSHDMDIAYLSALSAVAGSVVGGLTSGIATWLSQRAQVKAGELAKGIFATR
jgi:hypothetical protein